MVTTALDAELLLIGHLVARWNELEHRVRELMYTIAPDALTAHLLTADLQVSTLIGLTRMVARERQTMAERINSKLRKKRVRTKLYEPFYEHAEYFLTAVDLLREHRNHYIHGIMYNGDQRGLHTGRITSRKRLSISIRPIQVDDLRLLNRRISDFVEYGEALIKEVSKNNSPQLSARPCWPKRPPVPQKLVTPWLAIGTVLEQAFSA